MNALNVAACGLYRARNNFASGACSTALKRNNTISEGLPIPRSICDT